jgi:hypothetical protein
MADTPILDAEAVLTTAIRDALAPLVGTYNGRPKAYYQQAEQGAPLPYVVFQFQSDISRMDWLSDTGATVLVTVKALAGSASAARTLLATVAPGMDSLTDADYALTARYVRSPAIPPSGGVWQSAHIYRIRMERI